MTTRSPAGRFVKPKGRFIREVAIEDRSAELTLYVRLACNDAKRADAAIREAERAVRATFPDSGLIGRTASARGRPVKQFGLADIERWEAALRLRLVVHPEVRKLRAATRAGDVGVGEVARRLRALVGNEPAESKVLACARLVVGRREAPRTVASKVVQLVFPEFSIAEIGQDMNRQLPPLDPD